MLDTIRTPTFHRGAAPVLDRPETRPPEHAPPPGPPSETGAGRWPPAARAVIAVLAVLALLSAFGLMVALLRTSSESDTTSAEQARDDAVAQLGLAEQARDDALDDLATAEQARDDALDDLATAARSRETVLADLATAEQARDDALAEVATVTAERDEALDTIDRFATDLLAQTRLTNDARAERDALAALFPIELAGARMGGGLAGTYDVELTEVYCEGPTSCTLVPAITRATISETAEGWLQLSFPDRLFVSLYRLDGALYGITESSAMAPECGTQPRRALVSTTVYPLSTTIDRAGRATIDELGASLTVRTMPTDQCGYGLAVFDVRMIPTS